MKINPTSSCLSLVLHAIDNAVLPEVTSASAKGALGLIHTTLTDLLKRQGPSIRLLRTCNEQGQALRNEILSALNENPHNTPRDEAADELANFGKSFEELSEEHDALTRELNELCVRLSSRNDSQAAETLRRAANWELNYYAESQKIKAVLFPETDLDNDISALSAITGPAGESEKPKPLSRESMQSFLRSQRPAPLEVVEFSQMTGGYGKQTYSCLVKHEGIDETEDLIIRKCDAVPIIEHSVFRVEQEFELLRALSKSGFPAPTPIELGSGIPGVDGSFYTMHRLPGHVPSSFLGISEMKFSEKLILRMAELLGQLHSVPLNTFADYAEKFEEPDSLKLTIEERYRRNIRSWRQYVLKVQHLPSPYLTWLFDWLEQNIPSDTRPAVLTHGDFNFHNIMVDGDDVTGVLDWECSDLGAPEQDIVYVQSLVTRHMPWQRFLDHYHAHGGHDIDSRNFPFCQAYSVLRTMIAFNRATLTNQLGTNPDIRFMMVTFAINAAFMQMGLAYTAPEGTASADGNAETKDSKDPNDPNPTSDLEVDGEVKVSVSHFEGEFVPPVALVS